MLATDAYVATLRIVHIVTGVIWIGWLTVGTLLAISGITVAAAVTRPTIGRLVSIRKRVAGSGDPPPLETAARIGALQHRLVVAERVSFSLVLLAVVAMSSARYL